jgi:hypothetical protein
MSKTELNSCWTLRLKLTDCLKSNKMFKNYIVLSDIDDRIRNAYFVAGSGSESALGTQIPDAGPGDRNHADPCGC